MRVELAVTEGWQSENSPPGMEENFKMLEWHKAAGDRVERHDCLFTYDAPKGIVEYYAPNAGRLVEICIPVDDPDCEPTHERGAIAGVIETED